MCIIVAKQAGVKFPDMQTLEHCWENNPDGAGLMWAIDGTVFVEKGFMTYGYFKEFIDKLKMKHDLDKIPMVLHFRITTHGGTSAQNTHPFPITDEVNLLKKLRFKSSIAVAHNGIISMADDGTKLGLSDTQMFIKDYLSLMDFPRQLKTENGRELIERMIGSKMAFLESTGTISLIGHFNEHEGIYYSNNTYTESRWSAYDYSKYGTYVSQWKDKFNEVDSNSQFIEMDSGEVIEFPNNYYFDDYSLIYEKISEDAPEDAEYNYIGCGVVFDKVTYEPVLFNPKKEIVVNRNYTNDYSYETGASAENQLGFPLED